MPHDGGYAKAALATALASHACVAAFVLPSATRALYQGGLPGLVQLVVKTLRVIPCVELAIEAFLANEVSSSAKLLAGDDAPGSELPPSTRLPEKGRPQTDVMKDLERLKLSQQHAHEGKTFAYVYENSRDGHNELIKSINKAFAKTDSDNGVDPLSPTFLADVTNLFLHDNALNPNVFPALRRFEVEVVAMAADMLHGKKDACGSVTSGGTESVLMAMKAYRDYARATRGIERGEILCCETVHPAFEKAAHYFDMTTVHVKCDNDYRMDVAAAARAITRNTVVIVGSAPQYSHGIVDPIPELSDLALKRGLPLHVDACFGGYMLPWVEHLGYPVPEWDFRVPGVTSISADIHKYGYGPKGASTLVYRNARYRKYQYFAYARYPGGLFGSPGFAGTRPGNIIAGCWATLQSLGVDGYVKAAKVTMETCREMQRFVREETDGLLDIVGKPHMTAFAMRSTNARKLNVFAVADAMEEKGRGWKMERQSNPDSLHCTVCLNHAKSLSQFKSDLKASIKEVLADPSRNKGGTAAMYGMVGNVPDPSLVEDFIVAYLSDTYTVK